MVSVKSLSPFHNQSSIQSAVLGRSQSQSSAVDARNFRSDEEQQDFPDASIDVDEKEMDLPHSRLCIRAIPDKGLDNDFRGSQDDRYLHSERLPDDGSCKVNNDRFEGEKKNSSAPPVLALDAVDSPDFAVSSPGPYSWCHSRCGRVQKSPPSLLYEDSYCDSDAESSLSKSREKRLLNPRTQTCVLLLVITFAISIYTGIVAMQLKKMVNSTFVLQQIESSSLCSDTIQFSIQGLLNNPSLVSIGVSNVKIVMFLEGSSLPMFTVTAVSPKFVKGGKLSSVIRPGMNRVHLITEVLVENRFLAATVVSKMISQSPIHLRMKYDATVSLQPLFILPIELPIDGESFLYPNQPGTSSVNTFTTDAVHLTSVGDNKGLMLNVKWSIVHSPSSANISFPIPELKLAILSGGHTIALVTNDIGQYSLTSIQSTTIVLPSIQNSFQAKEIRRVAQQLLQQNLDALAFDITGISDNSAPVCMLQNVLNLMPPTPIKIADVVTEALRRQEQAIIVKGIEEHPSPAFSLKTIGVKLRSIQRSQGQPLSVSLMSSIVYSSEIESNVSISPLKLDIGVNDGFLGRITATPLPVSLRPDGLREVSIVVFLDRFDEDQLVSLLRNFLVSKNSVIPTFKVIAQRNAGFLSDMLSGVEILFPSQSGQAFELPFGLQSHILLDGGKSGDPLTITFTLTSPARNYAFFKSVPLLAEIPPGSFQLFAFNSKPLINVNWTRCSFGYLDHPTAFKLELQIKYDHALNVGKLLNAIINNDVISGAKISIDLTNGKVPDFELKFADFRVSDIKNFHVSRQDSTPSVFLKIPNVALEMVDVLSAEYTGKLRMSLLSRLRHPVLNVSLQSFPQLHLRATANDGEVVGDLLVTERVQQADNSPFTLISSTVFLNPSFSHYPTVFITGADKSDSVADLILSKLKYNFSVPASGPFYSPLHLKMTSGARYLHFSLSTTISALKIGPSIRFFLQPMRIVVTDFMGGRFLDIGSVVVKPMILSYKENSEVKIEINIHTSNREKELELARLIKQIYNDRHHRAVIQLFPDPIDHIDGFVPFHLWVNSSTTSSSQLSGLSLFELQSVDIIPVGSIGESGTIVSTLSVPCFMRFPFCPFNRKQLDRQFGAVFEVGIRIASFLKVPLSLAVPQIYVSVEYENASMMQISTNSFDVVISAREGDERKLSDLRVNVTVLVDDIEVLGAAYDSKIRPIGRRQPVFSIHTLGHGGNFVSRILSQCRFSTSIESSEAVKSADLRYSLVHTDSSSATIDIGVNLQTKSPVDLNLGETSLIFYSKEMAFAEVKTVLKLSRNSPLNLNLTLHLFGDADATPDTCQGNACVNPKMFNINKIFDEAFFAFQENTTFPGRTEVHFSTPYNSQQVWSMNFTLFDQVPPLERTAKPQGTFGILESMSLDIHGVMLQIFSLVKPESVAVPLKFQVRNPLNFPFSFNKIESEVYFTDQDGVLGPFVYPFKEQQPSEKVKIATVTDSSRWSLPPNSSVPIYVNFLANKTEFMNVSERLVDEQILHRRLCLHLENTKVDLELRAPNREPLLYTQQFALRNYPAVSPQDCLSQKACYPKLKPIRGFSINNFITKQNKKAYFVINGDATVALNGSLLDMTNGRNQHSSVFWNEPIPLLSSWAFETDFLMQRLSLGKGHGIAIVIQGQGALARSRSKWGINFDNDIPELAIVFDNGLKDSVLVYVNGAKFTQTFRTHARFDDGKFHSVRLIHSHLEQRLDLFIDKLHVLVIQFDLRRLLVPNHRAWIGVTASSGFINYSRHIVRRMKILQAKSDFSKMKILENGMTISSVGVRGHFTLDSRDTCGMPLFASKPANLSVALADNEIIDLTEAIEDSEDGLFRVPILIQTAGIYHVMINTGTHRNRIASWMKIGWITIDQEHG